MYQRSCTVPDDVRCIGNLLRQRNLFSSHDIYTIGVKISNKCYFPASSSPAANVCVPCSTFVTMWKEKKFSICSCILSLSRSIANFSPLPYFSLFLLIFAYEPATRLDGGFVVNPLTWRREKRGQLDLLLCPSQSMFHIHDSLLFRSNTLDTSC